MIIELLKDVFRNSFQIFFNDMIPNDMDNTREVINILYKNCLYCLCGHISHV